MTTPPARVYIAAMDAARFLSGQFLLAMPGMGDPRFDHAVIAMCGHDADGAIGIGIGATLAGLSFHDLLDQMGIASAAAPDAPVHVGGPVEPRRGFVIHTRDWSGQDTIDVAGRWALSGTIDVLSAIAEGRGPARWLAALGYAGWAAGQLDAELTVPAWLNVAGDTDLLFATPTGARWTQAFAAAGIDARLLATESGRA